MVFGQLMGGTIVQYNTGQIQYEYGADTFSKEKVTGQLYFLQ